MDTTDDANQRALLRTKQADFEIPLLQIRWYAAVPDEGGHPHIHMMVWSNEPEYDFLCKDNLLHL